MTVAGGGRAGASAGSAYEEPIAAGEQLGHCGILAADEGKRN